MTIHTLRRLGLDLTGDGGIDIADVKALSRSQASDIFLTHYFEHPRIDEMPPVLQASLFDMYVNAGGNAVRTLQRMLCDMGYGVAVDGAIGPQTVKAAWDAAVPEPEALRDAYGVARRNYYFAIADGRVASRKFAQTRSGDKGGWIRRAEAFLSPRYHLTRAQFQQRVAAWG